MTCAGIKGVDATLRNWSERFQYMALNRKADHMVMISYHLGIDRKRKKIHVYSTRSIFLVLVFMFLFFGGIPCTISAQQIIPIPQSIEKTKDSLRFGESFYLEVIGLDQIDDSPIKETLRAELEALQAALFSSQPTAEKSIALKLQLGSTSQDANSQAEGYELNIYPNRIHLISEDHAGLLYALQSLQQLLYFNHEKGLIPCQQILDYPEFSIRAVMDDISRGPLPNMAFMKKQIRRLAHLKINVLSFYIEHVLKTKSHPNFAPTDGLTITELHELSTYAAAYNIQLLGSFQSLGHFRNILSHPDYRHLGASDRMVNPADSSSLQFLIDIYDEIFPATMHPIFNINCDEAYDLSRGLELKRRADSIGEGGVYAQHISPLLYHVQKSGKRPAIWGDMLLKHPEIFSHLPSETLILPWNYSDRQNFDAFIDPIISHGLDFVACPGLVNSYRIWPDLLEAKNNIKYFSQAAFDKKALGTMTTVWDDGGRHFFATDWYGIAMGSAFAWNPDGTDESKVGEIFSKYYLGGTSHSFPSLLRTLAQLQRTNRLARLSTELLESNYQQQDQDSIFIDTSELEKIQSILFAAKEILNFPPGKSRHTFDWSNDLLFWKFKIDEMIEAVMMPIRLLEISHKLKIIQHEPNEISRRNEIFRLRASTKSHLKTSEELKTRFKHLWFAENRNHWYHEAIKLYETRVKTWKNLHAYLVRLSHHGTKIASEQTRMRPVYIPSSGTFITYWLGAGPFAADRGIENDYFAKEQGERNLQPAAIDYFLNQSNVYQGWDKIISPYPDKLDFNEFYHSSDQDVAYSSCQLESTGPVQVLYELRSTSTFKLFLGSNLIARSENGQDIYRGTMQLASGKNYLLFKALEPLNAAWEFSFRLVDVKVKQNKYKYRIE